MKALKRWYDMEYEFVNESLKHECFYGTLNRYRDIHELLEQFEKTGKVHFEYRAKKIMIVNGA